MVDDDLDFVESVKEILANSGYSIQVAYTGEEVLEVLYRRDEKSNY